MKQSYYKTFLVDIVIKAQLPNLTGYHRYVIHKILPRLSLWISPTIDRNRELFDTAITTVSAIVLPVNILPLLEKMRAYNEDPDPTNVNVQMTMSKLSNKKEYLLFFKSLGLEKEDIEKGLILDYYTARFSHSLFVEIFRELGQ